MDSQHPLRGIDSAGAARLVKFASICEDAGAQEVSI